MVSYRKKLTFIKEQEVNGFLLGLYSHFSRVPLIDGTL